MGISFDLSVEDLPDGIFDAIVAAGFHKQDPYTIGRWDGITPQVGSWIVNDIQVANNTVLICGSYLASFDSGLADPEAGSGVFKDPQTGAISPTFKTYDPLTMTQSNQEWRDGFFAAVSFDWINTLAAWHLVCTRSALEMGPAITGFVDPTVLDEGGLYSMVIDYRTLTDQTWLYVTAVGYTGVKGLDISGFNYVGSPPPFDDAAYTPYQYSVFQNQDYYPQMFSFLVAPYESTINNPGDTWTPNGRVNPYLDKSGQPAQLNTVQLLFNAQLTYLHSLNEDFVQGPPQDQLGRTMHLQMFNFQATNAGSPSGLGIGYLDWSQNYFVYYDVALAPLEQYTYRGHQIGLFQMPYSGVSILNPYGRNLPGRSYCPTPTFSIAPIIKPIEFTMGVPGFQIYDLPEPGPQPYHPENVRTTVPPNPPVIESDGHIWRHGFIPRKLKSIYRTQSVFTNTGGQQFTVGNDISGPKDGLGTLVIGGECLVQDYDARLEPISGQARSTAGVLDYEPLLLYGQNGFTGGSNYANENVIDIGVFFAFTKRNFCIEDVTAGGTVNSSLDNASVELIAPCLNINISFVNTYPVLLCVQITQPESRAEMMVFQPDLVDFNKYSYQKYVQDTKVVGPYASKGGVWETATGLELGTTWHNVGAQPDPFTQRELSFPSNRFNIKTYSNKDNPEPYNVVGAPTGRSIILGGNTTRRTPQGTWAVAYDTGSLDANYGQVINPRTPATPLIDPLLGFQVLKVSKNGSSGSGFAPQELDYYYNPTNTQLLQQVYTTRYYHIPNTGMQYPVAPPAPGWEWRSLTGSSSEGISINGYRFGLLRPGAPGAPPTGFYSSLQDLVNQLNAELAYIISDPTIEAFKDTPTGLVGITFAITSDNKGVYAETDSQYFVTDPVTGILLDPTTYEGKLFITDPLSTWNVQENYPYCTDPMPGIGLIEFPWSLSDPDEYGQAATVAPLSSQDLAGCFLDIGELLDDSLNPPKPITVGSERFFMSADYDNDRDQWLISLTDMTEKFTVLATTTDFSVILDQTSSIEQIPANRGEGLLLALNQKTNALDGVAFAGDYKPIHGVSNDKAYKITGTTGRTVKVFLNYMLYDGLDSMIAVELSNLGLSVTPENVLWYKTTILNANADQEVTLEEIESWMDLQKQQYQEMLKNRKPIQRDTGSDPKVDDYILDDKSIADLLPELDRLPPNPDSHPTDADMMGNTLSGDIQSVEEKRRESDV